MARKPATATKETKQTYHAIATTYLGVRKAYGALSALASGRLKDGDKSYTPEMPFKVILKMKRMMGVLQPLVIDLEAMEKELMEKYGFDGKSLEAPDGLDEELGELYKVEVKAGAETLFDSDLSHLKSVPVSLVGVLVDMGPFFVETGAPVEVEDEPEAVAA